MTDGTVDTGRLPGEDTYCQYVKEEDGLPSREERRRITGDPLAFVKVATGRGDPAAFGLDKSVNIYRA